ncbi:hypothetical protein REPUB_Repub18cG0171500 [Reevesia pubescens]
MISFPFKNWDICNDERNHDDVPHLSASDDNPKGTVVLLDLAGVNKERGQNPLLSRDGFPSMSSSQARGDQVKDVEDLWGVSQSRDELLQAEWSEVEELTCGEETLKKTLHEKGSQFNLLEGVGEVGQAASEIVEVEPLWAVAGTSMASQVRSLHKFNNNQVAIPIDMDDVSNSRLEDEDIGTLYCFLKIVFFILTSASIEDTFLQRHASFSP